MNDALPVDDHLPEIIAALQRTGSCVLIAPTGSGKTTRVPPAIVKNVLPRGQALVMLEPRRVAARAAARRMAFESGRPLGDLVGYQVRHDRSGSSATRLWVVTEGILTQRLQGDPFLEGVGCVVLDEFHERGLQADLALALLADVRATARPDLCIVVMSATLDPGPVAEFLGQAPVIEVPGRSHPVTIDYLDRPGPKALDELVGQALVEDIQCETDGDVLAFLPGAGEIARTLRRVEGAARSAGVEVLRLHGDMPAADQDAIFERRAVRRVILATNVAETSITIPGVRRVVDSGWVRRMRHDAAADVDRLELERISRASADQRAGRAGREAPGRALRLWTRADQRTMEAFEIPEIRRSELATLVLELLAWGSSDPRHFAMLEAAPAETIDAAERTLLSLGAVDGVPGDWRLSPTGREMVTIPLAPRLARFLIEVRRKGLGPDGALMAALASERDILRAQRVFAESGSVAHTAASDLFSRLDLFREAERSRFAPRVIERLGLVRAAVESVRRVARSLEKHVGAAKGRANDEALLQCVLAAFADRVARRRAPGSLDAVMVGGRGLRLDATSVVRDASLFCAVSLISTRRGERAVPTVTMASAIDEAWLEQLFPGAVRSERLARFDAASGRVEAIEQRRYLDLVLDEKRGVDLDPNELQAVLMEAAAADLDRVIDRNGALGDFLSRVGFLREHCPELELPELDDEDLATSLAMTAAGCRSLADLRRAPLLEVLRGQLNRQQLRALSVDAPERWPLPAGRTALLRYEPGRPPVLSARVQELFGLLETPRLAMGRVSCLIEILAPNRRPVQLTQDLASFWDSTYALVRKDLRGRYPKHAWPEDPRKA